MAEPHVSPDSTQPSQDSMNEDRAKANVALTEDVAITGETQDMANTDTKPYSAECSEDTEAPVNSSNHRTKAEMAETEDLTITNANTRMTQGISNTATMTVPVMIHAHPKDFFEERTIPIQQQVPAIVRNIYQRLLSNVNLDARLKIDIVRLAEEHPDDVVLTLLRCAPTCDRAAVMIWRTIGSLGSAVEKVLPTLLCVMANWPVHSICTSDGDDRDVFAMAAALVIWVIIQVPECHEAMILYSSRLFVALLFHVVITTQQMPPVEASNFWKACQEEHRLPSKPNRFAVQAMKALLCRLRCDNEVMSMERKRGWDTLLCAQTQHYAMGLLAREMRRNLIPLCSRIAVHLLRQLNRQDPSWDLPFLAFLVEVLECLDLRECGGSVLKILLRYLHSKCRERHRLALRALVVLSKDALMARRMCCLSPSLLELLDDADGEVVSMSLHIFTNVLQHKDILVSSTTAPKLAEALLLLFDHDNSHVQVLSIELFRKVMELVVDEGKKPLKTIVNKSLYALLKHVHYENCNVAKASRETLLCAAGFLKRRDLEQLLKKQPPLEVNECLVRRACKPQAHCSPARWGAQRQHGLFSRLPWARAGCPWSPGPAGLRGGPAPRLPGQQPALWPSPREPGPSGCWPRLRAARAGEAGAGRRQRPAEGLSPRQSFLPSRRSLQLAEDRSRAPEHLRRALRYLQRPQEPLREAAIRFMGMAGRCLRRQQQELQLMWSALQARRPRASPSCPDLENQAEFPQGAQELGASSGSSEPVSQEEHQETPKMTSALSAPGSPGTADAGPSSHGFSALPPY
ncbi:uncharacterized protein LOC132338513 [Haemorhous mexicanus]|uniref:uncharacterized protein LOC132338513 n=1 Tax=Haemorhous mexicanus TaxID=30427 RepID=UPI0028BD2B11|nr:uncharacterized protein LOC132338513 [Haemorhous mexicanus]